MFTCLLPRYRVFRAGPDAVGFVRVVRERVTAGVGLRRVVLVVDGVRGGRCVFERVTAGVGGGRVLVDIGRGAFVGVVGVIGVGVGRAGAGTAVGVVVMLVAIAGADAKGVVVGVWAAGGKNGCVITGT